MLNCRRVGRYTGCPQWWEGPLQIKSNHFYFQITTAHVPWWVKFLRACSRDNAHIDTTYLQTYTDDNVQYTHTYTQHTQCTIRHTYSYQYTSCSASLPPSTMIWRALSTSMAHHLNPSPSEAVQNKAVSLRQHCLVSSSRCCRISPSKTRKKVFTCRPEAMGSCLTYPSWRSRQRSAQCSSGRWGNNQLMVNTKLKVYQACVLSSLLYGSETWSTYIRQENRLESFHLCCLLGILSITWQCHQHWSAGESRLPLDVSNALWALTAMAWACASYGGPPKDLLYGELAMGHHPKGCPMLRFKDVCKRDMKLTDIDPNSWELVATNCWHWRHVVREGVKRGEEKRNLQLEDKRQWRKQRQQKQIQTSYLPWTASRGCTEEPGTRDEETRNFFETFNEHGTEIAGDRYTHSKTLDI